MPRLQRTKSMHRQPAIRRWRCITWLFFWANGNELLEGANWGNWKISSRPSVLTGKTKGRNDFRLDSSAAGRFARWQPACHWPSVLTTYSSTWGVRSLEDTATASAASVRAGGTVTCLSYVIPGELACSRKRVSIHSISQRV